MNPLFARNVVVVVVTAISGIFGFAAFSQRPAKTPINTSSSVAVAPMSAPVSTLPEYTPPPMLFDTPALQPSRAKGKKSPSSLRTEKKMASIPPTAKKGNETFLNGPTLDSLRDQLCAIKKIIGPEPVMQAYAVVESISPAKTGSNGFKILEVTKTSFPRYEEALRTHAMRELSLLAYVEFPFDPSLASECEKIIKTYIGPEPNIQAFAVVQTVSPEKVRNDGFKIPEATTVEYPGYEVVAHFYLARKKALQGKLSDSFSMTARKDAVWIPGYFTRYETFVPGHFQGFPDRDPLKK